LAHKVAKLVVILNVLYYLEWVGILSDAPTGLNNRLRKSIISIESSDVGTSVLSDWLFEIVFCENELRADVLPDDSL
jgi:hypothetical protein